MDRVCVCVYAVLLRTASSQSISRRLAESTVNTGVRRLYTVRRREAGESPELSPSSAAAESSRAVSRASLTCYRLSQRQYGVVDNNGDFLTVR